MSNIIGVLGSAWFGYGVWYFSGSMILLAILLPFGFLAWKYFADSIKNKNGSRVGG